MPIGVGAELLQHIPAQPFIMDPGQFFAMTEQNVFNAAPVVHPGPAGTVQRTLLQAGVVSKLRIVFDGTLVVATAAVTTSDEWPYALVDDLKLSANGQTDLFSVDGCDLHVLRFARYPAYEDATDVFPGTVGGGDSVAVGSYQVTLTYEVPIAMDDTSLVGALYAQSNATNLTAQIRTALMSRLFSANPANATLTGTWYVQETVFEIPFDAKGNMVIPDLSKLHGVNALDTAFANVGDVPVPLVRSEGQLARLFISARSSATNRLSGAYNAAASKKIDRVRLEYGGNKRPYVFDPAGTLQALNNQWYHRPLPYDRLAFDFVRENPIRDAVMLQGVTELKVVPVVDAGVTVTAGKTRLLQETLY